MSLRERFARWLNRRWPAPTVDEVHPPPPPARGTTTDRTDPRLTRGVDVEPTDQAEVYLVLSEAERVKGYVRPLRRTYVHTECGGATTMSHAIAETYARDPGFYGATYCVHCRMHRPLVEFVWDDGSQVGS